MTAVDPADTLSARFVAARAAATGLSEPGAALPETLAAAYMTQHAAITAWNDEIAGWKVGRIGPDISKALGAGRFLGPIFRRTIVVAEGETAFPCIPGGFAALEAELAIIVGADAPAGRTRWSAEEAAALAGPLHLAIEVAGSPLAFIDALGPLATIAGFGNNLGLILGPEVDGWRALHSETLTCVTRIDGLEVGAADVIVADGPLAAFAFALGQAAALDRPLRRGQVISTGALTGIHRFGEGQRGSTDFGRRGRIDCVAVMAQPSKE